MATNIFPPDIDEILSSDEWKNIGAQERNSLVDDWALQAKNASDWSPEDMAGIDQSIDRFRSSADETLGEQAGRIIKEGAIGGVKSLASLPLAVPKLGYQAGSTLAMADIGGEGKEMQQVAPDVARLLTGGIQTVEGAKALYRENDPNSEPAVRFQQQFNDLRNDILSRKLPEDPDALYEYLKKKGFQLAKATAKLHGGKMEDYLPQEFQGGNDEALFRDYLKKSLAGKRPEGFIEFQDDTLPTQGGTVIRNQSRSLISSPENLGLLMKFSATRNPAYFEALRQRLGRSLESQATAGMNKEIEENRQGSDAFEDAARTIFSAGGAFPEAGEAMAEQTRSMAQSPVDMASTMFSFAMGKQALQQAARRNLLKAAGSVAASAGTEFLEGAASGLQDQALPTAQNLVEEGLMEAVGGGVMQAGGAGVGLAQSGIQYLQDRNIPIAQQAEEEAAPLLTPEQQAELADVEVQRAEADQVESVLPVTAEALREDADLAEEEILTAIPVEEQQNVASAPIMVTRDMMQQLLDLGYTRAQVNAMRPAEAQAILSPTESRTTQESEVAQPVVEERVSEDISPPLDPVASTLTDEQAASQYPELSLADLTALEVVSTGTSESDVYRRGNEAVKVAEEYNAPDTVGARIRDKLLADQILGDGTVRVEGVYRGRNGVLNPVFAQPFIEGRPAEQAEIDQMMRDKGFVPHPMKRRRYLKVVDGVLYEAQDVDQDNVIVDAQGVPHVIDASVYAVDQPTPEETQAVQNAQGTESNASASLPAIPDASQAEVSLPASIGPQQEGITPPVTEAPSVEEDVVVQEGSPMPVGEVIPPRAEEPEFSDEVNNAASLVPEADRFGSEKVFISDAFSEWRKTHPNETLESFKQKVLEAQRAGKLDLSRADLIEAMPLNKVADSEIPYHGATFHFIRLPEKLVNDPLALKPDRGYPEGPEGIREAAKDRLNPAQEERFIREVLPAIQYAAADFPSIQATNLDSGGGLRVSFATGGLLVDPVRLMESLPEGGTLAQRIGAVDSMLDEEFRHSVSLELEANSPEFAKDLRDVWDSLPTEVKELSAKTYGRPYRTAKEGRHEFFRQYWQNAEVRSLTEAALRQEPTLMQKFQKLLDSFLEALKRLQAGAVPELKPLLDRLVDQATQRANELRQNAPETTTQEAIPPPVQPAAPATPEPESPKTTSLKRAVRDAERQARGVDALPSPKQKGWSQSDQEAAEELRENPRAGFELVEKLKASPRALSQTENSLMLFHKARVMEDVESAYKAVSDAKNDTELAEAEGVLSKALEALNDVDVYDALTGSESGRSLNARKMSKALTRQSISLASLLQKYRSEVNSGKALSTEEKALVKKASDSLNRAMDAVDSAEEAKEQLESDPIEKKLAQEALKEAREARESVPVARKKHFKDSAKAARDRLKARVKQAPDTEDGLSAPELTPEEQEAEDYAIIGAEYIEEGATSQEAFTKRLVDEFGGKVRPQANAIYDRSKQIHAEAVEELSRQKEKAKEASKPSAVLEAGKKRVAEKNDGKIDRKLAADLFKAHVRSKPSLSAEEVNALVTKDLQSIYPNATESDVRVAITDYGKAKWPSKDAFKKRVAEYKRILRLIESRDRIVSGRQALKSGLQRDKPTARERELNAEIKEAMKKFKVETTAEDQLASTKKAIENRLKNQIEDLNRIIEGKAKPKTQREQIEYDAELNALVKERDTLKAQVDQMTGNTKEVKWNKQMQATAKASAENYRRKIAQADFAARSKPNYSPTEATRKLQEEAAQAKAEFDNLKDLSGETQKEQLESQRRVLQKKIDALEKEIQTGEKPPAGKPKAKFSELAPLKEQLKALKQTAKFLEGTDPESKRAANAAKAIQRSIDNLKRRIAQKDTTPTARRSQVENEELKKLREERDFQQEIFDALKEAQNPRRLPEEIALDNFKRRVEKLRYEAENAVESREYLEAPPDDRIKEVRDRAKQASFDLRQAKKAWNNELVLAQLTKKGFKGKIMDKGIQTLNLARALVTSHDLSAILRQGGFLSGYPIQMARAVIPMWRSLFSEQAQHNAMEDIRNDPDYAAAERAGLFLADMDDTKLSKTEEAFYSRWVNEVKGIKGAALSAATWGLAFGPVGAAVGAVSGALGGVQASQRAYITFLNSLRFSVFKAITRSAGSVGGKLTREEGQYLANAINVATGRGVIGPKGKWQPGEIGTALFFAPRLVASRFNLLFGQPLYGGTPRTRREVQKMYARFGVAVATMVGLVALMRSPDDDEPFMEFDPRSSDFGKARFGETRLDLLAGLLQATVFLTRIATGETVNAEGEEKAIANTFRPLEYARDALGVERLGETGTGPYVGSRSSVTLRFLRSKLSPIIGAIANLMSEEDYMGKKTSVKKEVDRMITPMSVSGIVDAMEEQGAARGAALSILSLMGAGMQTYKPKDEEEDE